MDANGKLGPITFAVGAFCGHLVLTHHCQHAGTARALSPHGALLPTDLAALQSPQSLCRTGQEAHGARQRIPKARLHRRNCPSVRRCRAMDVLELHHTGNCGALRVLIVAEHLNFRTCSTLDMRSRSCELTVISDGVIAPHHSSAQGHIPEHKCFRLVPYTCYTKAGMESRNYKP